MSLTDCKNVALTVENETTEKKTPSQDHERQLQERSQQHQPRPNILVLLVVIATASGVCAYAYHITLRIHRLEQRVEMMSDVGRGSAAATTRSIADRRRQTDATSTTSTTTSSADTSAPEIDDWSNQYYYVDDYDDVDVDDGSALPQDDEDAEKSSGDDSWPESYERSYELPRNRSYYEQTYAGHGRHKRSAEARRTSDDVAATQRRRRQQQQQSGHRRLRAGHRTTSPASSPADISRHQRRRDRQGSERQRRRPHAGDDATTGRGQISGLKAAHFYAPRGPINHYVSGTMPPATFPFWQAENWTMSQEDWFSLDNRGFVTILESGLYMVYAQLVYHDLSGRWSFGVYVRDAERVKCMNTEQIDAGRHQPTSPSHGVYQHCYTSAVLQLSRFDNVSIRCLYGSRSVVMQPEFTFWGLIQLRSTAGPR